MAAPLVALGLALSRTNMLAQSGVTAVELMSNTVSMIADAFGRAFRFAMDKAMEAFIYIDDGNSLGQYHNSVMGVYHELQPV